MNRKGLKTFVASVVSAVFILTSANGALASTSPAVNQESAVSLTKKFVQTEDHAAAWNSFTESQKAEVKNFISTYKTATVQDSSSFASQKVEIEKNLSENEKLATLAYFTPISTNTEVVKEGTSPDSALTASATVTYKWVELESNASNVFGQILWRWFHKTYWGYDGEKVSDVRIEYWPAVEGILWSYVELMGKDVKVSPQSTFATTYSQGHFKFHVSIVDVQHAYPRIGITIKNDGTWTRD